MAEDYICILILFDGSGILCFRPPVLPHEKLELLHGESHFYETICGLIFHVEPFSIMNVNSSSSENVYNSIIELAEPTPDTVVLDLCSGTGGIAFTIARVSYYDFLTLQF